MGDRTSAAHSFGVLGIVGFALLALAGCSGNDGAQGPSGSNAVSTVPASAGTATALNISISGATVSGTPVVNFKVTDQNGSPVSGLAIADLRFTIAKLVPGLAGGPSRWQNYINLASSGLTGGYVRGNREGGASTGSGSSVCPPSGTAVCGTLVDHSDGTYTYTFKTNITNTAQTCPLASCIDANGNAIDTSYDATLTHRVAVQTRGTLPAVNGVYTFRPSDGASTGLFSREIVKKEKCNECHNKLQAHDSRVETQYCVTCHNPGSTAKGQDGTVTGPLPVDFKVMIHKIHRGQNLHSVSVVGGDYGILGFSGSLTSFKDVAFPQDIRNCTKCHDGTTGASNATSEGDNWKTVPSKAACGSCHDNLYFGASPDPAKTWQTVSHITVSGNTAPADPADGTTCLTGCHVSGGNAGAIADSHAITAKLARGKFKFNVLAICGVAVGTNGTANTSGVAACQPGGTPTVKFSVTDPTGATTHGYGNMYHIFSDAEFWNSTTSAAAGAITVDIAWDTRDYKNTGGSQARPARANQFNVFGGTTPTPYGQTSGFTNVKATDNLDGTFTLTAATPIPASAIGTGVVAIEGRAFSTVADPALTGTAANRIPIKGEVAYFGINDSTPKARRVVADAATKCDNCHDQLSLHGGGRNDNVQLCVLCHNPNNTDASASARPKALNHLPIGDDPVALAAAGKTAPADGKKEESIDLKRMIHGIHAAAKTSLDGTKTLEGFREKGIFVSGTDFSDVRFPGILNDCSACHVSTSYQLTGTWETPAQNSILGGTIDSAPSTIVTTASASTAVDAELNDPSNDLKISPTAAVCSSCHDSGTAKAHMVNVGGALWGNTQANIAANYETCAVCHGPGTIVDVQTVHSVK